MSETDNRSDMATESPKIPVSAPFAFTEELRHAVTGGLRADDLTRGLYATDASIYQIEPLGACFPRTALEISALMRAATRHNVPVIPRGGGSGLAGEALGRAVIFDTTNHLNRILEINTSEGWARAECGVVLDVLNTALRPHGKKIGPDPASGSRCTIGGIIANNSTGAHSLYYGHIRNHVAELECVLSTGETVTFRPLDVNGGEYREMTSRGTLEARIYREVRRVCETNEKLINEKWPRKLKRHRSGYMLHEVFDGTTIDLTRLIAGSEGTLAVITGAKLRVVDIPKALGMVLLLFPDTITAARAVGAILAHTPYALELLDHNIVTLARNAGFGYEQYLPEGVNAALMAEFEAQDMAAVNDKLRRCAADILGNKKLALGAEMAADPGKQAMLWRIRKSGEPLLYGKYPDKHPVGFIEDAAVDPCRLHEYLEGKDRILRNYGVDYATYSHAGAGVLHTRPYLDLTNPADLEKMEAIANETYDLLVSLGGSISGEHGDGLCRTQFLIKQFGPELYRVFHEVKDIFDPLHILNPGKIVYNTNPHLVISNLRHGPGTRMVKRFGSLVWKQGELERESKQCNGCGECRAVEAIVTMCPVFKSALDETASPRAKGNLMRLVADGRIDAEWISSPEFKRIADKCVNCKACHLECPVHVNVPMMMIEAKAQYARRHGQTFTNQLLINAELISRFSSLAAPLANWGARNSLTRAAMESVAGIDRRRKLPLFSPRPFLSRARERYAPREPNGRRIVYFIDLYANYNDPELAEAFIRVMNHNGVEVIVPRGQNGCGMPAMDYGSLGMARRIARHNARLLRPWIEQGCAVAASEPTAALMLKEEYGYLERGRDIELLAGAARDAMDYLCELDHDGLLRKDYIRPIEARFGYHAPCHLKALRVGTPGLNLVREVPGVSVKYIDRGCCGIAGTWGMKTESFEISMAAGGGLIAELNAPDIAFGLSECSTCKIQMEQACPKPTLHPLKILAHAYGLMDFMA